MASLLSFSALLLSAWPPRQFSYPLYSMADSTAHLPKFGNIFEYRSAASNYACSHLQSRTTKPPLLQDEDLPGRTTDIGDERAGPARSSHKSRMMNILPSNAAYTADERSGPAPASQSSRMVKTVRDVRLTLRTKDLPSPTDITICSFVTPPQKSDTWSRSYQRLTSPPERTFEHANLRDIATMYRNLMLDVGMSALHSHKIWFAAAAITEEADRGYVRVVWERPQPTMPWYSMNLVGLG